MHQKDCSNTGKTSLVLLTCYFLFTILLVIFFRMRAQARADSPPEISAEPKEGPVSPLIDGEVQHCAAVIVAAFLNPSKLN